MTVSSSDMADALRWLWIGLGIVWVVYAWLHRVAYRRAVLVLLGLFALDWELHAFADFTERPDSNLPSDFPLYSVMILVATGAGLAAACFYAKWRGMDVLTALEAALVCVIAGGLGGRLYHIWMHWEYYSENRDFIADLTQGGLGMRGALVCGFLALALFALLAHSPFWQLADAAAVGLAMAQSIGWYGAALTHMHYGIALDTPLADSSAFAPLAQFVRGFGFQFVQELPDAYNLLALRVPVQTMTSLFYFALFLVLLMLAARRPQQPGTLFLTYWIAAAAASVLFGFWRGDETLFWSGLRADQWMDLGLLAIGLALAALRHRGQRVQRRALQHA